MHSKMSFAICFNLDQSKILSSGNGLNIFLNSLKSKAITNEELFVETVFDRVEALLEKVENAS